MRSGLQPCKLTGGVLWAGAIPPCSAYLAGVSNYLLLLPAAEALGTLRPLAASNSSACLQQVDLLTAQLLAPQAARILNQTQPGRV